MYTFLARILGNASYFFGRTAAGVAKKLIGVNAADKVSIDEDGLGSVFGGSVRLPYGSYLTGRNSTDTTDINVAGVATLVQQNRVVFGSNGPPINGVSIIGPASGDIRINDNADDVDTVIESDTNPVAFVLDSGAFSGVGALGLGAAFGTGNYYAAVVLNHPALTTIANLNYARGYIGSGVGAVTIPAGTAPKVATLVLEEPNITAAGTVSDAYTLIIDGAPTEGTRNGALWVVSGQVRISVLPTSAAGLPAGTIWNNSGVLNVAP